MWSRILDQYDFAVGGARKHDTTEIDTKQEISRQGWLGLCVSHLA